MTVYVILFAVAGPWPSSSSAAATAAQLVHAVEPAAIAAAALLAWRVTRGGALARRLIIFYTGLGVATTVGSPGMRSGSLITLGLLAIYVAQVALLVSTPVYNRTRRDQARPPQGAMPLWTIPPRWLLAGAVAGGLVITLISLGNMGLQPVPGCQARGYLAPHSAPLAWCETAAEGYPVHFLSTEPSLSLDSGTKVTAGNLDLSASPLISKSAAAKDVAIWGLASLALLYLLFLPSPRPARRTAIRQPVAA
jgi:hypothetical protein